MKKLLTVLTILALLCIPSASAQGEIKSISMTVYETGYVKVREVFVPLNVSVIVAVPLLTGDVASIFVVDDKGNPLPFELNGSKVDVYFTGNVSEVVVTYFTAALTSKNNSLWTLRFSSNAPVTIHFPRGVIIVDLSDVPLSITENSITMPPGNQSVSYTLPVPSGPASTTTTSTGTTTSPSPPPTTSTTSIQPNSQPSGNNTWVYVLVTIPLIAGALYYIRASKREVSMPMGRNEYLKRLEAYGLNDEEIKALLYVYDQGGKARQADVRKALGIPKTTAWRMFKRLEEKDLVRVYKKGKENWVELIFT